MDVDLDTGHVTDPETGKTLAVTPYYCAHCRGIDDGEGPCVHKEALCAALEATEPPTYHPAMPDADAVHEWRQKVYS